jgi:hypothetical protein
VTGDGDGGGEDGQSGSRCEAKTLLSDVSTVDSLNLAHCGLKVVSRSIGNAVAMKKLVREDRLNGCHCVTTKDWQLPPIDSSICSLCNTLADD